MALRDHVRRGGVVATLSAIIAHYLIAAGESVFPHSRPAKLLAGLGTCASERNRVSLSSSSRRAADAGLVTDDEPIGRRRFIGPEPRQWENSGDKLELVRAMDIAEIHMDQPSRSRNRALLCMGQESRERLPIQLEIPNWVRSAKMRF